MKSKEALKRLYYDAISSIIDEEIECLNREEIEKDYMCIKQDLERLKKSEEQNYELIKENYNLKTSIKLLIYKCVDILHIRNSKNVEEYNKLISEWYKLPQKRDEYYELLQEEFDLLKEYLDDK